MNNRFKEVRNALNLTQTEMAKRLGIKQSTVTAYETNNRVVSERTIQSLCERFDVDEHWFRTGEGEMFPPLSRDEEISAFVGEIFKTKTDTFKKRFLKALSRLDENGWELIEKMAMSLMPAEPSDDPETKEKS